MASIASPSEEEIRSMLGIDPVWAAYAIGDLAPDYAPYCQWRIAASPRGAGLALLFSRLSPPALFAMGDVDAVERALEQHELPDAVYLLIKQEHLEVISRLYAAQEAGLRHMWRMYLTHPDAVSSSPSLADGLMLRALDLGDTDRMLRLFANGGPYAPDAFDPYQVADGAFFGVIDAQGEAIASGGTHVVDWQAGVAAIGNMYTHPEYRGQGLGGAVLQAIVRRLLDGGVTSIVLNVDNRNRGARRLYERYGFEAYCPYVEGIVQKRAQ